MRPMHGKVDANGIVEAAKSAHVRPLVNLEKGDWQMFVRAVWRSKRLIDIKQTLRQLEVPTTHDPFGVSGTDFQNMTRGLFDR